MSVPLGNNIGNALEVKEALDILSGRSKGTLYRLCIELAAEMLELAGKGTNEECRTLAAEAVSSGKALDILEKTIALHGGDSRVCRDNRFPAALPTRSMSKASLQASSEVFMNAPLPYFTSRRIQSAFIANFLLMILEQISGMLSTVPVEFLSAYIFLSAGQSSSV